ncbi:MAG TPA: hypothetical protein VMS31_08265 [Pyrinomonadaceae bacterium]|nr:hypothetical protein [Pyrinomonadaceae bacterium]
MENLNLKTWLLCALIIGLGISPPASAQHGGKAEGLRVRFARGSTSATFKDKVRGSLEIEYELEALAGQELLVRVLSSPAGSAAVNVFGPGARKLAMSCLEAELPEAKALALPTASHCFNDSPQRLVREGKTWSATLPESGNYMISVFKPQGDSGVTTYTLLIAVVPTEKNSSVAAADTASLEAAMRKLITSLMKKDVTTFLSMFSRSRFFFANNPMNEYRMAVPYSDLSENLRQKGDWYCTYLERCDDLDAFVDHINDGEMWSRVGGAKFVPPGSDAESLTYVKWRKENGKWVIDEISYPQA